MARDRFEQFFREHEPKLRLALSAEFGFDLGREGAAEAFSYAWEHWHRVEAMNNPVGYIYRVGQRHAIRQKKRPVPPLDRYGRTVEAPWIEPRLSHALSLLSRQQRICVVLVYCLEWTQVEVAHLLGIAPTTVQNHVGRGLARLRTELEVPA